MEHLKWRARWECRLNPLSLNEQMKLTQHPSEKSHRAKKKLEAAMHRDFFDGASEFASSKLMFSCKLPIRAEAF